MLPERRHEAAQRNALDTPGSPALAEDLSDTYYALRDQALASLNGRDTGGVCLALTSCRRGEGVTTVAVNFARALCGARHRRVLLCDANVPSPALHRAFGLPAGPGLTDALAGHCEPAEAVQRTPLADLDLVAAGRETMSPAQMAESARLGDFLEAVRQGYAFVLLDAPPVLECSAGARLAAAADAVILVIEAERNRWEVARAAARRLEGRGAHILGAVLNKRKFHIPEWLYRRIL